MGISSVKKSKGIYIHQAFPFFLCKVQEQTLKGLRTKKVKGRCLLAALDTLTKPKEELNT